MPYELHFIPPTTIKIMATPDTVKLATGGSSVPISWKMFISH